MRIGKNLPFLVLLVVVVAAVSCVPEQEQITFDTTAKLRFSADSITFDTVFTNLGSVTQRLKVFNDSKNAVRITDIAISENNSPFTITVNGQVGTSFQETRLLGEDSLLILVEVFIDPRDEDLPFLVTDQINFETNGNLQDVDLVAYGRMRFFLMEQFWTAIQCLRQIGPTSFTTPCWSKKVVGLLLSLERGYSIIMPPTYLLTAPSMYKAMPRILLFSQTTVLRSSS
jgi:hypothetical protein